MQLIISHPIKEVLELPINYNYIIQSILYSALRRMKDLGAYIHESNQIKLFSVSPIRGKYQVKNKRIYFYERVSFEVRSPNPLVLHVIKDSFDQYGITYNNQHYPRVETELVDETIESEDILIRMDGPICVYSTDFETKYVHYYTPWEDGFYEQIWINFIHKYEACYGVLPEDEIGMALVDVKKSDKVVTKYKNMILSGWKGVYRIAGKRKYLDFLYQTGLGTKNSQGFGMFTVIGGYEDEWE